MEALQQLAGSDEVLKTVISSIQLAPIKSTNNVFHDLMSCILEQQIHYRSTKKIFQKMLRSSTIEIVTPQNFTEFEAKAFTNAKLSTAKYETVLRTIEYFKDDTIDWQVLSDSEVIEKLSSIKGIGKWTIDMILLYTLQRPTIFPYDDFHLKQIMINVYGLNPKTKLKAQMLDIASNWGNHKSLAVLYLLATKKAQLKK